MANGPDTTIPPTPSNHCYDQLMATAREVGRLQAIIDVALINLAFNRFDLVEKGLRDAFVDGGI